MFHLECSLMYLNQSNCSKWVEMHGKMRTFHLFKKDKNVFFLYFKSYQLKCQERETNVWNLVVPPTSESGQIPLHPAAILSTPTLHLDRQSTSSILKPVFTLSSSTYFFHVLFSLHFYLWPLTYKSNALLMTWQSSLLNTWPYQWTLFAIANHTSVVSFRPNINIMSLASSLALSCTPHTALTVDLSVPGKTQISLSFKHHTSN